MSSGRAATCVGEIWRRTARAIVGGLREVGFAPESDLLLVVSFDGRGLVDAQSGARVARDDEPSLSWLDEDARRCEGIGPIAGASVEVVGLIGGRLPDATSDGWRLECRDERGRAVAGELTGLVNGTIVLVAPSGAEHVVMAIDDVPCELRAIGFSPTGRSFALAWSCELLTFAR